MNLVFFLEEPSAREMLKGLLPRMFPFPMDVGYVVFEGKQDLDRNIARRLRGWRDPNSILVVMRDQDAADCSAVKRSLVRKCRDPSNDVRHRNRIREVAMTEEGGPYR